VSQAPLFLLAALQTGLAVFVLRAKPASVVHRRFATQTLLLAAWVLAIAGLQSGVGLDVWGAMAFASASLIPAAFLAFTNSYATPTSTIPPAVVRFVWLMGGLFALFAVVTDLIVYDNQVTPTGLTRKSGSLYPFFALYFLVTFLAALGVFLAKWRRSRDRARAQLQYLAVGITISAAGGIGINLLLPLLTGRSEYNWLGPYFSLGLVTLTAHAIIRHRLMDIRLVAHRGLIYALLLASAAGSIMLIGRAIAPHWPTLTLAITADAVAVALVATLLFSSAGQSLIHRVIDPYLYRGHLDHAAGLRLATHRLSQLMEPTDLASRLRSLVTEAFIPESFAMVACAHERGEIEVLVAAPAEFAAKLVSGPVSGLLQVPRSRGPRLLTASIDRETDPRLWRTLDAVGVELLVSLERRDQLLGFLLLGPRRSGDAYFKEDLGFIESLAELASIALDNSLLYRQKLQMLEYSDRLVESIESAVIAIDAQGRITSSNPAARTLFPSARTTLTLHHLPPEVAWALAFALMGQWLPKEVEISVDHPSRGAVPLILSAATLRDEGAAVIGALIVATDLSRVKALERNQRRTEHLTTMARFYAGIAHEIRSPLASISNFIAMLPDRFGDPEYRDTAVRLLPSEVARIVRLADRLRSMAPSDSGKLAPVRIQPLLADIVAIHSPAAAEAGVAIRFQADEDCAVLGDANQLTQLFVNLFRNAVEAMPCGGTVTIEGGRCASARQQNVIFVAITDEGRGIDPSIRPHIFAPFFTTKQPGTGGLGLTICREIAEFHGARLELRPRRDGRGTTAIVQFATSLTFDGQVGALTIMSEHPPRSSALSAQ
jgi:signal transduction histidine kinase